MIALLSGAWWAQRLTGIIPQALAIAVAFAAASGAVAGGIAWLRHDARMDERAACDLRVTKIERAINDAANERISAAAEAAAQVQPAPRDDAGLKRLCDTDPACRGRGRQLLQHR